MVLNLIRLAITNWNSINRVKYVSLPSSMKLEQFLTPWGLDGACWKTRWNSRTVAIQSYACSCNQFVRFKSGCQIINLRSRMKLMAATELNSSTLFELNLTPWKLKNDNWKPPWEKTLNVRLSMCSSQMGVLECIQVNSASHLSPTYPSAHGLIPLCY